VSNPWQAPAVALRRLRPVPESGHPASISWGLRARGDEAASLCLAGGMWTIIGRLKDHYRTVKSTRTALAGRHHAGIAHQIAQSAPAIAQVLEKVRSHTSPALLRPRNSSATDTGELPVWPRRRMNRPGAASHTATTRLGRLALRSGGLFGERQERHVRSLRRQDGLRITGIDLEVVVTGPSTIAVTGDARCAQCRRTLGSNHQGAPPRSRRTPTSGTGGPRSTRWRRRPLRARRRAGRSPRPGAAPWPAGRGTG